MPSIACKGKYPGICRGHFSYHPSWSQTRLTTEKRLDQRWYPGGLLYDTVVSKDSFAVAGLGIPDQEFQEGQSVFAHPFTPWLDNWDAVLGLAPDSHSSQAGITSPLDNILERGMLNDSTVSFMLGRYEAGYVHADGELLFGGIDSSQMLPNTSMRFLTMSNKTDPPDAHYPWEVRLCNSTWQVPAQAVSITFYNNTSGQNQTERVELEETYTARLDTVEMFTQVPDKIYDILLGLANPMDGGYWLPYIDCFSRRRLPNLVFTLGTGDESDDFVLTPFDYTLEIEIMGGQNSCYWALTPGSEMFRKMKVLSLGSSFVRGYYVSLDKGRRRVGLGTPWWRSRFP